jgi:FKBP-type peptidyl-prolyl cis-trans isomerase FkpA
MKQALWLLLALPALIWSCVPNVEPVDQLAVDDEIIRNYLAANNLQAQRDASGIYFSIVAPGAPGTPSNPPVLNDTVQVHYTGTLLNGNVFDTSRPDRPARFDLAVNRLIAGWLVMLPQMRVGERRLMYLPSDYAYGGQNVTDRQGRVVIPAQSVLVFDVELLGVGRRR